MKDIRCDTEKFVEYQLDKELLQSFADEIAERTSDYYSFSNLELALAVYNYIEKNYSNATIHFYRGQHICCSDTARRKLHSKMISWRDNILKDLSNINSVLDEFF